MNNNYTHVTILLDRSGSMDSVHEKTVEGLNSFLDTQRGVEGECTVTLIQFDHHHGKLDLDPIIDAKPVKFCKDIRPADYQPRGNTPLHDAMASTIRSTGKFLRDMSEAKRPAKVVFCVITDGLENASKEHNAEAVADMVKQQTEKYKWEFVFVGANQNAILTARNIGIDANNALNYAANDAGTVKLYASIGSNLRSARMVARAGGQSVNSMNWTPKQRKEQEDAGAKKH